MFDHIKVNVYGEEMQLNGIAQVVIKSPTLAVINPYDQTVGGTPPAHQWPSASATAPLLPFPLIPLSPQFVQQIANAVRDALSLNPQEDGKIVKVPLPKCVVPLSACNHGT